MKKCNSITVTVLDLNLHANRFSSDLVHRCILFPLTLLLLEKLMIINPDNTVLMSKQVNCVNIEPEILHGNWSSYWKYKNPFTSCKTDIISIMQAIPIQCSRSNTQKAMDLQFFMELSSLPRRYTELY